MFMIDPHCLKLFLYGYFSQHCCVKNVSSIFYFVMEVPIPRKDPDTTHTHTC